MNGVRVFASGLRPPGPCGLEERARPGPDELAGVPQRAARDPDLDRGVHQLRPRAELLRGLERALVRDDQLGIDRNVVELRPAADRGALAHHVPVRVQLHAGRVALDEGQDQAVGVI